MDLLQGYGSDDDSLQEQKTDSESSQHIQHNSASTSDPPEASSASRAPKRQKAAPSSDSRSSSLSLPRLSSLIPSSSSTSSTSHNPLHKSGLWSCHVHCPLPPSLRSYFHELSNKVLHCRPPPPLLQRLPPFTPSAPEDLHVSLSNVFPVPTASVRHFERAFVERFEMCCRTTMSFRTLDWGARAEEGGGGDKSGSRSGKEEKKGGDSASRFVLLCNPSNSRTFLCVPAMGSPLPTSSTSTSSHSAPSSSTPLSSSSLSSSSSVVSSSVASPLSSVLSLIRSVDGLVSSYGGRGAKDVYFADPVIHVSLGFWDNWNANEPGQERVREALLAFVTDEIEGRTDGKEAEELVTTMEVGAVSCVIGGKKGNGIKLHVELKGR